ncbi:hypothetical protein BJV82DRAFT_412222 [Fennellomyces sp. T-0311]|nr:hypothetical protein BJV82DRAFT_412222 [Fennellomyces sp. T-0311]
MFQAPPLLKFPSLDILRRLTRGILDELLAEENEILQNKRGNLVFKQFGGGGLSQKGKRKQKVSNACHHCKRSKVGCDGYYPCDNCIKRSKQCEYPPGVSPPPRPTPVETLPTPTELPEPSGVPRDPPTQQQQQQQPPFAVSRFSARQQQQQPQQYFPPPDSSVPLVTENVDTTPSLMQPQQPQQQQACTDQHGHFTGDTTFFVPQRESAPVPAQRTAFPQLPPSPQFLSYDIQISLIDTFYMHANPFFPAIMNKAQTREELELLRTDQHANLSLLFFHALFSRAASLTSGEEFVQGTTTWSSASDILLFSAFQYRDAYLDSPHISTLLALVIVANHLEHKKLAKNLRKAWMLIGDAGRLAIDMGLHRASRVLLHPDGQDDPQTQMCIRTFWAVCVSERTMSITYGRPSMFDDKDMCVLISHPRSAYPVTTTIPRHGSKACASS